MPRRFAGILLLIFSAVWLYLFRLKTILLADNGCGGNAACGIVNVNIGDCDVRVGVCRITPRVISMGCDVVTQDECRDVIYPAYCNNIDECATSLKRISCCISGGGGGEATCPPGQYWRTEKECRQACTSGWVPAGNINKDCCH